VSDLSITVVIPVHRDAAALRTTLDRLRECRPTWPIIVVDSDHAESRDEIASICDGFHTALIYSPVGQRAYQMNLGAKHADTEWIWFLHADTVPASYVTLDEFERTIIDDKRIIAGGFQRRFEPSGLFLRMTSRWADWRGRTHGLYLGDQAMFVRRDVFTQLGGFPPIDKFEDVAISRTLIRHAAPRRKKIAHITPGIITSARRFKALGEILTTLRDLWWTAKYLIQGEPHTNYPANSHSPEPTAILMLKAPRPGTVKTRLAKTIGDDAACAAYRQMVEHQLRQIPEVWKVHVFYAPHDAEAEMTDWLASHGVDQFTPQCGGHLGDRLSAAGESTTGPVIFLGGDSPWMTKIRLLQTQELLSNHQAVINPAFDGGYTMLALRNFDPLVFNNIEWSTDTVFHKTIQRLHTLGWKTARLTPVSDVDTIDGWNRARELLSQGNQQK